MKARHYSPLFGVLALFFLLGLAVNADLVVPGGNATLAPPPQNKKIILNVPGVWEAKQNHCGKASILMATLYGNPQLSNSHLVRFGPASLWPQWPSHLGQSPQIYQTRPGTWPSTNATLADTCFSTDFLNQNYHPVAVDNRGRIYPVHTRAGWTRAPLDWQKRWEKNKTNTSATAADMAMIIRSIKGVNRSGVCFESNSVNNHCYGDPVVIQTKPGAMYIVKDKKTGILTPIPHVVVIVGYDQNDHAAEGGTFYINNPNIGKNKVEVQTPMAAGKRATRKYMQSIIGGFKNPPFFIRSIYL